LFDQDQCSDNRLRYVLAFREIEAQMAAYRADLINVDGTIFRVIDLVCPDDDIAKEHAQRLVDGHDVELWYGSRLLAKFKHNRRGVS
jgi:hypothetical protein